MPDYSKCNFIKYKFPGIHIKMCKGGLYPEIPECRPILSLGRGIHVHYYPCGEKPPFHKPWQPDEPFKFGDGWKPKWGKWKGQEDIYWKDATVE